MNLTKKQIIGIKALILAVLTFVFIRNGYYAHKYAKGYDTGYSDGRMIEYTQTSFNIQRIEDEVCGLCEGIKNINIQPPVLEDYSDELTYYKNDEINNKNMYTEDLIEIN